MTTNSTGGAERRVIDFELASRLKEPVWPWPPHDLEAAADAALAGVLLLPIVGRINISDGLVWDVAATAGSNSQRLWVNSLPFVHDLVEMHRRTGDGRYWRAAEGYFDEWWRWAGRSEKNWRATFADEHAVANRSCSLVAMLASVLSRQEPSSVALVLRLTQALTDHGDWLAVPTHYSRNNHGVMMDRALLQLAVVFGKLNANKARIWSEIAQNRLAEMFAKTFDQNGCCTENSPHYHILNVTLFEKIHQFCVDHGIPLGALHGAPEMLAKARQATAVMLRADHTLPIIGDTVANTYDDITPVQGFGYYATAGMAVLKTEHLELTVKCGGSTFTHRHVDDTSITVRYGGADIFVDSGMYSYDSTDRTRRHFISFRAHSGMFVERCKTVRFANFAAPIDAAEIVEGFEGENGSCFVAMDSHLVDGVDIERDIFVVGEAMVIRDRMNADDSETWRQQFVLHPDATWALNGGTYLIANGPARAVIRQYGVSVEASVESNVYSEKFMQKSDTQCLVFKGDGTSVELLTVVSLSRSDGRSTEAPPECKLTADGSAVELSSGRIEPIPRRRTPAMRADQARPRRMFR